jgi:ankyrin repeat protein
VNARNEYGETPLMLAAQEGNLDIAKALLNKGAEINAKDLDQYTAVSYAKGRHDLKMVIS